jgi:16S rRNA (guanine527-N7)-methyltransferase
MEETTGQLELIQRFFDDITPRQLQQLAALEELYKDWNNKINVISRKDIDSLYEKHVLHSLSIAAAFQFEKNMQVIDIGTGGGFPGIPLAIFFPDTAFHLVDSIGKKLKVVEAVRDGIGLTNVTTQHGRAEEIKGRKFDVAVSRAVAPLKDLHAWSKPLLKKPRQYNPSDGDTDPDAAGLPVPHGLICLKGGDLAAEIADSGARPRIMEITNIFDLEYFSEKYLLYIPY